MQDLHKRAWRGIARVAGGLALLLFLPAQTLDYWQAWVFLCVFVASITALALYLMQHDAELLRRRLTVGPQAETDRTQKLVHYLLSAAFGAAVVVPALDRHFGWSSVPPGLVALGDMLVIVGFVLIYLTFKANSFAAPVVEVSAEQKVISSGLYGHVRHPMYSGLVVMLLGAPLALGSGVGLLTLVPSVLAIMVRLLAEEVFLAKNLSGYVAYCQKVNWRLVPFVW